MKILTYSLTLGAGIALALAVTAPRVSAQQAPPPGTYQRRAENQQDRIAQGVKSGSLTAKETSHLESREAHIHQQVRADRAGNGGKMTAAERSRVNREQNRTSRAIYRDKHNAAHR